MQLIVSKTIRIPGRNFVLVDTSRTDREVPDPNIGFGRRGTLCSCPLLIRPYSLLKSAVFRIATQFSTSWPNGYFPFFVIGRSRNKMAWRRVTWLAFSWYCSQIPEIYLKLCHDHFLPQNFPIYYSATYPWTLRLCSLVESVVKQSIACFGWNFTSWIFIQLYTLIE
jgi:hypothetical protein